MKNTNTKEIHSLSDGCALCNATLSSHPIREGSQLFCCFGCHAVFNILSTKNQLLDYEQHPIFLEALRSGLISNPALLEQIRRDRVNVPDGEKERVFLEIGEMWCPSCAEIVKLMLLKQKGVLACTVDYATDLCAIEFAPRYVSREKIIEIIKQLGYVPNALDTSERKAVSFNLYLRFIVAAFCSLNVMMFAYPLYATYFSYDGEGYGRLFAWLSLALSIPVITYSAWPIWRRFALSLLTGLLGMETLVAIGVAAAFLLSLHELWNGGTHVYFDSMTVIIVFVLLGKIIEAKAKFSAKESLLRLNRSTPRRGRKRFEDKEARFVSIKEIAKEDTVVVFAGEKIVLDGIVIEGEGACDESLMTGEAIPVVKQIGKSVLGGTILVQGQLAFKVTTGADDTALHRIIEMVETEIGHKTAYIRAADHIVHWFIPVAILMAALTGMIYWAFQFPPEIAFLRAIAVLLISCPCAIGIAAPAAESYILNSLSVLGVIVRNRGSLSQLGNETMVIFDKTGTVTEGRFSVQSGMENLNQEDSLALYSLASHSTHPISCAIALALSGKKLQVSGLEEMVGHGLQGIMRENRYYLGSARFMQLQGIQAVESTPPQENTTIMSTVYFARNGLCLTELKLGDNIRPEIKDVLSTLGGNTLLLSGDAESTVAAVAKACGFNEWRSGCTPLEKREVVDQLRKRGEIVCMIGDGINDAPALTAAHVGISVATASDMSIQVSDLLLATERLTVLTKVRELARKGQKIIRQNLFWAFFYNVIGIFLAAFGVLSPIFAAFAMSMSSLTVLFNARRLRK